MKIEEQIIIEVKTEDISISHRLASDKRMDPGKHDPVIIVKFTRRDIRDRDKFYPSRKYLHDKTTNDIGITRTTEGKMYITESLTQQNRRLFKKCLEAKGEINYRFIWTTNGRILLRKGESSPTISVMQWNDLQRIYDNAAN